MTRHGDRIAGWLGASASLAWCAYHIDTLRGPWSFQALVFYALQIQVAVLFVRRRDPLAACTRPGMWLICGASLIGVGLFDFSARSAGAPGAVADGLTLAGGALAILGFAALGQGFGVLPAFRQLASSGPYSVVRHPVYAGYLLMDGGILLAYPRAVNLAVVACNAGLLVARIQTEEQVCAALAPYRGYMARVRYRLIPGVY